jgi:protein SCO1/2
MARVTLALAIWLLSSALSAEAALPEVLQGVDFKQHLNEQVPLDQPFIDDAGRNVTLRDYCHDRPVILVMAYYQCPRLCTLVLNGLVQGLLEIPFTAGRDFEVVVVSFDPREEWQLAASKKATYLHRYGRAGSEEGWHFLTGQQDSIRSLANAIGFQYRFDPAHNQFNHPAGILILTPAGKISRYFYDVKYRGRDLRLGLVEASQHRIGSPVDQILLYCFHYDPQVGRYSARIMNFVRLFGVCLMAGVGGFVFYLQRRRARVSPLQVAAGETR